MHVKRAKPAPSAKALRFQQEMSEGAKKNKMDPSNTNATLLETQSAPQMLPAEPFSFFRQNQATNSPFMTKEAKTDNYFDTIPGQITPFTQANQMNLNPSIFSFDTLNNLIQLPMHKDATVLLYSTLLLVIGKKVFGTHCDSMIEEPNLEDWLHYSP